MPQDYIAISALIVLGGLGACFILAAFAITAISRKRNDRCTSQVDGIISNHAFLGDGRMYPLIDFDVNGQRYICKKRFNGYKKIVRIPSTEYPSAWEDEKGYLCVRRGMVADMRKLASDIWPINSTMNVHYDPSNPKINYAGQPTTNRFTTKAFLLAGIGLITLGLIMSFIV